ncbi:malate synthase-like isoform X1 [Hippoglossus stenolepis]|uniref:malate synthase-like isoform X1 n=1 Tax=Hippoglossus stenolepis TaxID=195615 RepID=UPI001FAFC955|nr:malate synthase-like isoform X1 [Hippoglossus stenolepis]
MSIVWYQDTGRHKCGPQTVVPRAAFILLYCQVRRTRTRAPPTTVPLCASSRPKQQENMAVQCLQRTSHITIQKSTEVPVAVHKAGKLFHCPFCNETQFKPARKDKVEDHLEGHHNRAVIVEDLTIHRCGLGCKKMLHYHCPYCPGEILKRKDFLNHLQKCKKKCYSSLERIPPLPLSARAPPLPLISDQTAAPVFASPAAPASSLSLVSGPPPAPLLKYVITSNTTPSLATGTPPPAADSKKTTATLTNAALKGTPAALCPKKRVRQRAVIHKRCPFCEILINKCNLKRHIERKHTKEKNQDINASCHLAGEIIDQENGIYAVLKVFQGDSMHILCEHSQCQITTDAAQQSGLSNYLCQHIRSGTYITSSAQAESLSPDVLDEMIKAKWFGQEAKTDCLKRQELAYNSKAPLSVHTIGIPETKKCISVYEPTISHYSGSGRVMVVYDTMRNRWTCPCTNQRRSCIHTYIAKWHLFQTQHELFCTEEVVIENTEGQYDCSAGHKSDEDSSPVYPSTGATCQEMVSYIQNIKEIPAILPEDTRHPVPNRDYPFETLCQKCVGTVPLSDPVITKNDKLSNCCVIEGMFSYLPVSSICKHCKDVTVFYGS